MSTYENPNNDDDYLYTYYHILSIKHNEYLCYLTLSVFSVYFNSKLLTHLRIIIISQ